MKIEVLIADDHTLVREGVRGIMKFEPDIHCKDAASNGEEVLSLLGKNKYDLLLLDMTMGGLDGVELIKRICRTHADLPILVLSMHGVAQMAFNAINAGAKGYITKGSEPEKLFHAIRKVAGGGNYMDPHLSDELIFERTGSRMALPHLSLSARESEIFLLLAEGKSNQYIANHLFINEKTVSTYKSRIMMKMKLKSVADIVKYAIEQKLLD